MTGRPSLHGYRQQWVAALLVGALGLGGCAMQTERAPQDDSPADAYARLGEAYLSRDNLPRASQALTRALELAPDHAPARQAMAIVYQRQGDDRMADAAFQRALETAPNLTQARNNYAAFLYDQGRTKAACQQLQRASEDHQYPRRAQLLVNLGRCQQAIGRYAEARSSFQDALRIDPELAAGHRQLAELEVARGHRDNAERHMEHYRRLAGPDARTASPAVPMTRRHDGQMPSAVSPDRPEP